MTLAVCNYSENKTYQLVFCKNKGLRLQPWKETFLIKTVL